MSKSVFIIAFIFLSTLSFAQTPWSLKKDVDGIRIYTRMVPESKLKEYKAMTQVKTPLASILHELLDAPPYTGHCISGESYYVKQIGERQHVFYALKKLPWPIKDRDVVTQLTVEKISDKKVILHIKSLPKGLPEKEGAIRIKDVNGFWLLEEENGTTTITQQLYLNPEGSLPPVVTNSLLIKGPYKTFSHLQQIGS